MNIIEFMVLILKFMVLGHGFKCILEASKARENTNCVKEFRCLLWAILMLLSIKN